MLAYSLALAAAINGGNRMIDFSFSYLELIKPLVTIDPGRGPTPVPIDNPGLWVTTNDYPAKALQEKREGTVGFSLTVGPDGRVANCRIIFTSGSDDLDTTACTLISQRARFSPAKNAKGTAISGSYANRVRWQIPARVQHVASNIPIPKAGYANTSFIVDEKGRPSKCEITGSAVIEGIKTPCDAGVTFQPYYNSSGQRIRVKIQTSQTINITEEGDADLEAQ
jgi:TonB family protein